MTTQTDQMNETSFRSDEQAQSQDRERLQEDINKAWNNLMLAVHFHVDESDIKLLKWRLGVK